MFMPGSRACAYKTASGRGKWLSRDPIKENGGINLYALVVNDPVDYYDLYGLSACSDRAKAAMQECMSSSIPCWARAEMQNALDTFERQLGSGGYPDEPGHLREGGRGGGILKFAWGNIRRRP